MKYGLISAWTLWLCLSISSDNFDLADERSIPISENLLKIKIFKFCIYLTLVRGMVQPEVCDTDANDGQSLVDTEALDEESWRSFETLVGYGHSFQYSVCWASLCSSQAWFWR